MGQTKAMRNGSMGRFLVVSDQIEGAARLVRDGNAGPRALKANHMGDCGTCCDTAGGCRRYDKNMNSVRAAKRA